MVLLEMEKEEAHKLKQENGQLQNEDYQNVVTNTYQKIVWNCKLASNAIMNITHYIKIFIIYKF